MKYFGDIYCDMTSDDILSTVGVKDGLTIYLYEKAIQDNEPTEEDVS